MIFGVSVQREYRGPTGETPGLVILVSTNLTEHNASQFFHAAVLAMRAEWEGMGKPSPEPARVQLWLLHNE